MLTSEKRAAANRANAAHSTGPKTPRGKAFSSRNATTHGLLSSLVAVRNENKEGFDNAVAAYADRFQPTDVVEYGMLEEMVAASWRLRRSFAIEKNMFDLEMSTRPASVSELDRLTAAFADLAATPKLNTLIRYQTRLHLIHSRIIRDLIQLRKFIPAPADSPAAPEPATAEIPPVPNEPTKPLPINKPVPPPTTEPTPYMSNISLCNPIDPKLLT